ncbi:endonuclease/exonuclease/phosphatase family protein [Candidatus Pelagibacter sp.]|nr:endonuclease/exonuclease/phosphatase family protein [Candidatus Pelagibacter sp.]
MLISSWNVNSVRARIENIKSYLLKYKPDILMMQEIKLYSENLPILENDTQDIIEYVKQTNKDKKKKFNFWKLLENDK